MDVRQEPGPVKVLEMRYILVMVTGGLSQKRIIRLFFFCPILLTLPRTCKITFDIKVKVASAELRGG